MLSFKELEAKIALNTNITTGIRNTMLYSQISDIDTYEYVKSKPECAIDYFVVFMRVIALDNIELAKYIILEGVYDKDKLGNALSFSEINNQNKNDIYSCFSYLNSVYNGDV